MIRYSRSTILLLFLAGVAGFWTADPAAAASSTRKSGKSSKKSPTTETRKRAPDTDSPLADLRKQDELLAEREKSLQNEIATKKRQLAALSEPSTGTTAALPALTGRPGVTSGTLAAQRQAETDLTEQAAALDSAICALAFAHRVSANPGTAPTDALALYLAVHDAELIECQRAVIGDSIQRREAEHKTTDQEKAEADKQNRQATLQAKKLSAAIKQLEKDLDKTRSDRKACQSRIAQLEKTRKSAKKENSATDSGSRSLAANEKRATPTPSPTKPKPSPTPTPTPQPRAPLPPGLRDGTGLDLMVAEGTAVHAIEAGRVLHAGRFMGYGNLVIIEHAYGTLSLYGFLNQIRVATGTAVTRGQVIGLSGLIEDKDRPGLRFELRLLRDGQEVLIDPRSWLPAGADFQRRLLRGTD